MKINESTLVAFATARDIPADKEGYFVLKGNLLFYFEKPTDREPIGVIILEGCVIELAEEDQERFGFKISFSGKNTRVYHLGTEFQQTLYEWIKLLTCASHEYMKLMVYELEQKILELDAIDKGRKEALMTSSTNHIMTSSSSANALSSSSAAAMLPPSSSSHSLRSLPMSSSSVSAAAADQTTASTLSSMSRPNPFNSNLTSMESSINGPLLFPASEVDIAKEVFACNATAAATVGGGSSSQNHWTKYHETMGRKILADQKKWRATKIGESSASAQRLVDIG